MRGIRVRYYTISRLFLALEQARADGSYRKFLAKLQGANVLIIDDWDLEKLTQTHWSGLVEIMDGRYGNSSTVMISQLLVNEWHGITRDNTLADAILDRIVHNSHRLELGGEAMRKLMTEVEEPTSRREETGDDF